MCRDIGENRKLGMLLVMNQPVSVVSKAVCPASVRHSVALGKTAQQRRLFVMLAARFARVLSGFSARYMPAFVMHTAIVRFVKVCFLLFLVSDGVLLCAALYNQFLLLNKWFLFALLSVLLTIALACLLFDEVVARCKSISRKGSRFLRSSVAKPDGHVWPQEPASQWGHYVLPSSLLSAVPASRHFPETPLPSFSLPPRSYTGHMLDEANVVPPTPLIRVLETIDLSSTNIEHFLDIKTQSSFLPLSSGDNRVRGEADNN